MTLYFHNLKRTTLYETSHNGIDLQFIIDIYVLVFWVYTCEQKTAKRKHISIFWYM